MPSLSSENIELVHDSLVQLRNAIVQLREWNIDVPDYVFFILLVALFFLCAWIVSRIENAHLDPEYVPNIQDADGYRATRFNYWGFWFNLGTMLLLMLGLLFLFFRIIYDWKVIFLISSVATLACAVWMVLFFRKFYLTIDDNGIHGFCGLSDGTGALANFRNDKFNISWEKIERIKLTTEGYGRYSRDALAIYCNKYLDDPDIVIHLKLLSTLKVIDAIKFFSARNNKPNIISRDNN